MGSEAHTESGTPLTTKGDIYGFSTVPARLPVGTVNGQVLAVDSTTATGLIWQDSGVVVQAADQTFANNTLTNVTNLLFTMAASTSYFIEILLLLNSDLLDADYKFLWTFPASATMFWGPQARLLSNQAIDTVYLLATAANSVAGPDALLTEGTTFAMGASATTHGVTFWGIARNSTTAGSLQLQAAQNTTQAGTVTKLLKDSLIRFRKLQ